MFQTPGRAVRTPLGVAIASAALALGAPGCQSGPGPAGPDMPEQRSILDQLSRQEPPPADPGVVRASAEAPADPPADATAAATPGGPAEAETAPGGLRLGLKDWMPSFGAGAGTGETTADPETAAEFAAAESLYQKGDLDAAETAFSRIARKERKPFARLFAEANKDAIDRPNGSVWGMKSLYYLGEIKYQKGDLVGAHQKFEEMAKEYPGSSYMEKVVQREYEIAQVWLDHLSGADPEKVQPWNSRFWGGLPVFDTGGHAVAALEQVRLNDPKGPLADDAIMTIAEHYYKNGNFELAAEYFDQMTEDPELAKSPLLHKALLGGIDSKIKGYIGPEYDVTGLEQARDASMRTLQLFPERQASAEEGGDGPDLHKTLDLIADQEAERAFSVGSYYRRAGRVTSAEYYFGMIVHKWPKSEWADPAREQLTELAKMPRKESRPSTIMVRPSTDPFTGSNSGMGSGGGMGGMGAGLGGMGGMGGATGP